MGLYNMVINNVDTLYNSYCNSDIKSHRRRFRKDEELIGSRPLSQRGWNPIKLAYTLARGLAQLATSAFSHLSMSTVLVTGPTVTQDSPFSSLAVAVTIASTHFAYPRRDDQAELAGVAWLNTEMAYQWTVTHLSTNPARRRVTSLMCPTTLPLSLTTTLKSHTH